jgi:hypothetical protein
MQAMRSAWRGIGTFWATLCLALSLAVVPAVAAIGPGPLAVAAEADDRTPHGGPGQSQPGSAGSDHHDPGDHDPVGALPVSPGPQAPPPPERTLRPVSGVAGGMTGDGSRRPPRPTRT